VTIDDFVDEFTDRVGLSNVDFSPRALTAVRDYLAGGLN
jgi:hypothetical protein